jgi:hypothetical protein
MQGDGTQFVYAGDEGSRVLLWFRERIRAVGTCVGSGLLEASLTLLYSGIETLGFLAACPGENAATKKTFTDWCEKYLLTRLGSVDGRPLTALDFYAARCGVLHTSSSVSDLGRGGIAREISYRFQGRDGVILILDAKLEPVLLDIEAFARAFKEGGKAFLADLKRDRIRAETAEERARSFFTWETLQ